MSGKPPGLLKRLLWVAGDWLCTVLVTFGWNPGGKDDAAGRPRT